MRANESCSQNDSSGTEAGGDKFAAVPILLHKRNMELQSCHVKKKNISSYEFFSARYADWIFIGDDAALLPRWNSGMVLCTGCG